MTAIEPPTVITARSDTVGGDRPAAPPRCRSAAAARALIDGSRGVMTRETIYFEFPPLNKTSNMLIYVSASVY